MTRGNKPWIWNTGKKRRHQRMFQMVSRQAQLMTVRRISWPFCAAALIEHTTSQKCLLSYMVKATQQKSYNEELQAYLGCFRAKNELSAKWTSILSPLLCKITTPLKPAGLPLPINFNPYMYISGFQSNSIEKINKT